jgi:hypothetical protein
MTGLPLPRTRGPMIKDAPDHHDAELVLRLYELRREAKMREARHYLAREFWPVSAEEALALTRYDHPQNAFWRMVTTYWEMAYGMARHGIANPDYLAENTGEGIFLYSKVQPWLAQIREQYSPRAFLNSEWIATQCAAGRALFTSYRESVEKRLGVRNQESGVRGRHG